MADELIEIVQLAKANNAAALAALVARYQTPAYRVAKNILGNLDDAEDAVQDAWLLALRKLHTLYDAERFGGWVYHMVANVALRKRQQRAAQQTILAALALLLQPPMNSRRSVSIATGCQWSWTPCLARIRSLSRCTISAASHLPNWLPCWMCQREQSRYDTLAYWRNIHCYPGFRQNLNKKKPLS